MKMKMFLHSSKDDLLEQGAELGLSDEAMENFKYSLYEATFEVELDKKTGQITVLSVDPGDGGEILTR